MIGFEFLASRSEFVIRDKQIFDLFIILVCTEQPHIYANILNLVTFVQACKVYCESCQRFYKNWKKVIQNTRLSLRYRLFRLYRTSVRFDYYYIVWGHLMLTGYGLDTFKYFAQILFSENEFVCRISLRFSGWALFAYLWTSIVRTIIWISCLPDFWRGFNQLIHSFIHTFNPSHLPENIVVLFR